MTITIKKKMKALKEDFLTLTYEAFERLRDEKDLPHMHEILRGPVIPYFDVEKVFEDEADYRKHRVQTLLAAIDDVKKAFPKGKQMLFDASGWNIGKECWYLSVHILVRGAGYYKSPKHLLPVVQAFRTPVFDQGVYSEGKTMRMPYCSKEGDEKRLLRRIEITEGKVTKIDEVDCDELLGETYTDWIITNVQGEKKCLSPAEKDPQEDNPAEEERERTTQYPAPTLEELETYVGMLSSKRAEQHNSRSYVIWALKETAEDTGLNLLPLAHKFAATSADYDEGKTDAAYNKRKPAGAATYTYGSIRYWAKNDSPDAYAAAQKMPEPVIEPDQITYYDEKAKLLATKPTVPQVQEWMAGCIRHCIKHGAEDWFVRCTDGWHLVENKVNFPFGTVSSNSKVGTGKSATTFREILESFKDEQAFAKHCMTDGAEFYPYYGVSDRPGIINLFRGWPHKASEVPMAELEQKESVKLFIEHTKLLFPQSHDFVLDTQTRKIRFPREKGVFIINYGKFGGEGKNIYEMLLSAIYGQHHCLSSPGTKHILGQGEAGYNALVENKLICFIQEAKAEGKSITDDEKFKNWLTETIQQIRRMRMDPFNAPNYSNCFLWTNNPTAVKMKPAMIRRTVADAASDAKIGDTEYFNKLAALSKDPTAMQEIFDWLARRDISKFNPTAIPQTDLMKQMKETSLSLTQQYVVDLCNGDRESVTPYDNGDVTYPTKHLYADFKAYCNDTGVRFIPQFGSFKLELENLGAVVKQERLPDWEVKKPQCFIIEAEEVELLLRKFQKDPQWKLLRPVDMED